MLLPHIRCRYRCCCLTSAVASRGRAVWTKQKDTLVGALSSLKWQGTPHEQPCVSRRSGGRQRAILRQPSAPSCTWLAWNSALSTDSGGAEKLTKSCSRIQLASLLASTCRSWLRSADL